MKLIVGLRNPGSRYTGTRHNVGFDVIGEFSRRFQAPAPQKKFQSEFQNAVVGGEKVLLVAPMTYMNCSGEAVSLFVRFYKLQLEDLVIVCDDMNLPCGRIRWRAGGTAGGQKGLNDTILRLGTSDFPRVRLGIGRPPGRADATSWVLGRFREDETSIMRNAVVRAADSLENWVLNGLEATMNRFNREPESDESAG